MVSEILDLSFTEKEILRLIVLNYSNILIAKKLYLSVSTVKKRINKICTKMNANGRVHASFLAAKYGLIDIN